jgi:hypothetical protein
VAEEGNVGSDQALGFELGLNVEESIPHESRWVPFESQVKVQHKSRAGNLRSNPVCSDKPEVNRRFKINNASRLLKIWFDKNIICRLYCVYG